MKDQKQFKKMVHGSRDSLFADVVKRYMRNPAAVIGAVLLLVIDGRQPHSIGATYKDCIDVMLQYGAVNAANLDGGSSSMLVYNGEVQNVCASLYGSRPLPTAFIVTQPLDEGGN